MKDFILIALPHIVFAALIIGFGGAVAVFQLLNSQHGAISDWKSKLDQIWVMITFDRVAPNPKKGNATISGTLLPRECDDFEKFIQHHRVVQRVERRLISLRSRVRLVSFAILAGVAIGFINASPTLVPKGMPLTSDYPWVPAIVALIGTASVLGFVGLQHVNWWNALKDAAAQKKDS